MYCNDIVYVLYLQIIIDLEKLILKINDIL